MASWKKKQKKFCCKNNSYSSIYYQLCYWLEYKISNLWST